jgi:LacI family transcriptional regulator
MAAEAGQDMAAGTRATIKDVAREARVSFKTVSRVVNGHPGVNRAMREAVEQAMAELGYRPHRAARSLRTRRSYSIALLAGSRDEPTAAERASFPDYLGEVIAGCTLACRPAGFHLVLELLAYGDRRKSAALAAALFDDLTPDGILLAPPLCDLGWLLDMLEARALPYARLMPGSALERGTCLAVDDFSAARELTGQLLAAGHRRLGFITGPADHLAADARRAGFEAALASCAEARAMIAVGDFYLASGQREASLMLRASERPTALFAANDAMAAGALRAAEALGLAVPGNVAVAGFDDSPIATLASPGLTTVRQPTAELARQAAAILIEAANAARPPAAALMRLPCQIIERASAPLRPAEFKGGVLP